ncbi:MAG TPA: SDR family NAD(P)-dependent oxidoreductase, partial [Spirochaetota bacterium]
MPNTILVTGASKGLGLFLADQYLRRGDIVFALNKTSSAGEKNLIKKFPDRFFPITCDITSEKQVKKAAASIAKRFHSIDILINNAGIHREKPYTATNEFDPKIVRETFDTNAVGPLLVTKYFHEFVIRGNKKIFVNISSEAGSISTCWRDREYGYCMSKAALNMQSVILQNKLKPHNVKVLAIHPGWMRTDMGG